MERRDQVLIGFFVLGGDSLVSFGHQVMVNKRTFFE